LPWGSKPPKGTRAPGSVRLLENKVVDSTSLIMPAKHDWADAKKKTFLLPIADSSGRHHRQAHMRVRSRDGRRVACLTAAQRSRLPDGLRGRDLKATSRENARADFQMKTGAAAVATTRTAPGTPTFMMFAPNRRLGPRQSHGSPHRCGLRSRLERLAEVHWNAKHRWSRDNLKSQQGVTYEAFPDAEARRLVERLEWHYTQAR